MDDLEDLQARVAAAQEKLQLNSDVQRKYGLRLNDVVSIVEGSLARQQEDMKRLQDAALSLRLERDATRIAEGQTKGLYEAALNRLNLLQAQNDQLRNMVLTLLNVIEGRESPSALQGVLLRLEGTVKEITAAPEATAPHQALAAPVEAPAEALPEAAPAEAVAEEDISEVEAADEADIELDDDMPTAAESTPVAAVSAASEEAEPVEDTVMDELEEANDDVEAGDDEAEEIAAAPAQQAEAVADAPAVHEANTHEMGTHEGSTPEMGADEMGADEVGNEMTDAVAEDFNGSSVAPTAMAEEASNEDMPEDLHTLSMNGHRDVVMDADEIVAHEELHDEMLAAAETPAPTIKMVSNTPQDEGLVTALLDAEKALIEAGASGVANANSPVAEIIRRISLRTREFSEASGV